MNWIIWGFLFLIMLIVIILFLDIVIRQKHLDTPCKGLLIVDHQDIEGPCMVYLQALVDPGEFKDGESVKLKVRLVRNENKP